RRRHTRFSGDWSSDVCFPICAGRGPRGDAQLVEDIADMPRHGVLANGKVAGDLAVRLSASYQHQDFVLALGKQCLRTTGAFGRRSEERRVGKECRTEWTPVRQ